MNLFNNFDIDFYNLQQLWISNNGVIHIIFIAKNTENLAVNNNN